jgi:hypothetical protein
VKFHSQQQNKERAELGATASKTKKSSYNNNNNRRKRINETRTNYFFELTLRDSYMRCEGE